METRTFALQPSTDASAEIMAPQTGQKKGLLDLPSELILLVATSLPTASKSHLNQTNKWLHIMTTPELYREVNMSLSRCISKQFGRRIDMYKQLKRQLKHNPDTADYVRKLSIDFGSHNNLHNLYGIYSSRQRRRHSLYPSKTQLGFSGGKIARFLLSSCTKITHLSITLPLETTDKPFESRLRAYLKSIPAMKFTYLEIHDPSPFSTGTSEHPSAVLEIAKSLHLCGGRGVQVQDLEGPTQLQRLECKMLGMLPESEVALFPQLQSLCISRWTPMFYFKQTLGHSPRLKFLNLLAVEPLYLDNLSELNQALLAVAGTLERFTLRILEQDAEWRGLQGRTIDLSPMKRLRSVCVPALLLLDGDEVASVSIPEHYSTTFPPGPCKISLDTHGLSLPMYCMANIAWRELAELEGMEMGPAEHYSDLQALYWKPRQPLEPA